METNIMVVDDEKEIRDLLEIDLSNEGYKVFKAENGEKALEILQGNNNIQLMVLDVMMPGMDGFEVCQKARQITNIPILFLSAKSQKMDKLQGILIGADDYMVKPFDSLELNVKIKSLLRRAYFFNNNTVQENCIQVQSVLINKDTHKVTVNDNEIPMTATEFSILYFLASNKGKVLSSEEIFENVWKEKYFDSNNTVMVHVSRLREKLNKYTEGEKIIHTVWGVGYKIEK